MWEAYSGRRLYLDSNVLILAVESGNAWTRMLFELFSAIDAEAVHAVTSEVSLAEVLAKPMAVQASDLVDQYEALLSEAGNMEVVQVRRDILRSAARLQGQLGIKLVDAIHAATAVASTCDIFVSNLGRKLEQPKWLALADIK